MSIAFRAYSGTSNSGSSITVSKPTGVVEGDVMIAHIGLDDDERTISSAPSGWTQLYNLATDYSSNAVYYKVAGASEPSSYTWNFGSSDGNSVVISAYSGCDTTDPIDDSDYLIDTNFVGTHTSPTSSVSDSDNWSVLCLHAEGYVDSITPPSGFTERDEQTSPWAELADSNGTIGSTGSYTPGDWTTAQNKQSIGVQIILQTAVTAQELEPTGISSSETFGSFTVSPGSVSISPSGVSSAETLGSFTVSPGSVDIGPSAISSVESFGSFSLLTGSVDVSPSSIDSQESFGTPELDTGVVFVSPDGVGTGEGFGTFTVSPGSVDISPVSVTTGETFGSFELIQQGFLVPVGIHGEEAFGSFEVSTGPVVIGITGIGSDETFGIFTVSVEQFIQADGIGSAENFGVFEITTGAVSVSPSGISTSEAFGTFSVSTGTVTVSPAGIPSSEDIGAATVVPGTVSVSPSGISTSEAFGTFSVSTGAATVQPAGVLSTEAFGIFSIGTGSVSIFPGSVSTGEAFGSFSVGVGAAPVLPSSIPSSEAFGAFIISQQGFIEAEGIASEEAFGDFFVWLNIQYVSPEGIASQEVFGDFSVQVTEQPGLFSQFEEDIEEVFLNDDSEFAQEVVAHYKQEGIEDTVWAIFDNEYMLADVDSQFQVQSLEPRLVVQTRKLRRKLVRGDWFKVGGVTYSVVTSEPDGTGISVISLQHKV